MTIVTIRRAIRLDSDPQQDALIETSLGYIRSTGFLENPYKVVQFLFVDPRKSLSTSYPGVPPLLTADVRAVLEQRPDTRNQWTWNTRFVQYLTDWMRPCTSITVSSR